MPKWHKDGQPEYTVEELDRLRDISRHSTNDPYSESQKNELEQFERQKKWDEWRRGKLAARNKRKLDAEARGLEFYPPPPQFDYPEAVPHWFGREEGKVTLIPRDTIYNRTIPDAPEDPTRDKFGRLYREELEKMPVLLTADEQLAKEKRKEDFDRLLDPIRKAGKVFDDILSRKTRDND